MKQARNDISWIRLEDNDAVAGINMGYDFTAEHEWGIKSMLSLLQNPRPKEPLGIDRFRIDNPKYIQFKKTEKFSYLYMTDSTSFDPCDSRFKPYDSEDIATFWDARRFLIVVRNVDGQDKHLKALYDVIQDDRGVIMLSGSNNPFANSGLCLLDIYQFTDEHLEAIKQAHLDQLRLKKTVKKTGIEKKLEKAGCRYFALSPRWANDDPKTNEVVFWLNPMDQQNVNYGWFTLDDLQNWIKGTGRIPKQGN